MQNQAIGDSDAEISGDLRAVVYRMIKEGASDGEIKEFMVARYGRFVLYNPPLDKQTIVLWLGPVGLLILGVYWSCLGFDGQRGHLITKFPTTSSFQSMIEIMTENPS